MWRTIATVAARAHLSSSRIARSAQLPLCSKWKHQTPRFFSQQLSQFTEDDSFVPPQADGISQTQNSLDFDQSSTFVDFPDEIKDPQLVECGGEVKYETGDIEIGNHEGEKGEANEVEALENVLSLLQSRVDGSLDSSLDALCLTLNQEFVVRVLETPFIPSDNVIKFYNWLIKKSEFKPSTNVVASLVRAVSRDPRKTTAYALWDLVKDIGKDENAILNTEVLNEVVALFSRLGKGKAAFEVFNMFEDFGCVPNSDTYYFTIESLCRRSLYDWASSVTKKMVEAGCPPGADRVGNIISLLCKGKMVKDAHLVYKLAKERNQLAPQSSVNFLISSLCKEDETVKLALEILDDFEEGVRKHAIRSYSAVLSGLCRSKDVDGAKELLLKMISHGPPPGNAAFNSVINAYSKAGDQGEAVALMKLMDSRGLKPDVYTYTVIISGYVKGGQMEEACKVFSEAKKKHSKLSPVTYHTLIRGFCKLEEYDKAVKLLKEMRTFGVQPNVDEYNKLIQSLCLKSLDWRTAEKLLAEMQNKGLHLNGITRGLIRAVKELEEEELENGKSAVKV